MYIFYMFLFYKFSEWKRISGVCKCAAHFITADFNVYMWNMSLF